MTKEKAKELAKILLAYSEDKIIQNSIDNKHFEDISEITHKGLSELYYRIKPEKKSVPFTFEDIDLLKDKWFTNIYKIEGFVPLVNKFKPIHYNEGGIGLYIGDNEYFVSFNQLFNEFLFEDGSKCGKYIEE